MDIIPFDEIINVTPLQAPFGRAELVSGDGSEGESEEVCKECAPLGRRLRLQTGASLTSVEVFFRGSSERRRVHHWAKKERLGGSWREPERRPPLSTSVLNPPHHAPSRVPTIPLLLLQHLYLVFKFGFGAWCEQQLGDLLHDTADSRSSRSWFTMIKKTARLSWRARELDTGS